MIIQQFSRCIIAIEKIVHPKGDAIDQDHLRPGDGARKQAGKLELALDGLPATPLALLAMALDAVVHLPVDHRAGGDEEAAPADLLGPGQGQGALAAARPAGIEDQLGHIRLLCGSGR